MFRCAIPKNNTLKNSFNYSLLTNIINVYFLIVKKNMKIISYFNVVFILTLFYGKFKSKKAFGDNSKSLKADLLKVQLPSNFSFL